MKLIRLVMSPAFILFFSCSKHDDPSNNDGSLSGQWVIHYYWDKKDETSDFAGYVFESNVSYQPGTSDFWPSTGSGRRPLTTD